MLFLILLIILIISLILISWYLQIPFSRWLSSDQIEPFTRQFFNQITPTYFIGMDDSQLADNEFTFMTKIAQYIPFYMNFVSVPTSLERYHLLNQGQIEFILARAHELYGIIYKTIPQLAQINLDHVRYVCSFYHVPINVLTYHLDRMELGDLRGSGFRVNVGTQYSGDYFVAYDLIIEYDLVVGSDIYLSYYNNQEVIQHYGIDVDVVIMSANHPDNHLVKLINRRETRMMHLKKINDGDIFRISLDETEFYREHPYYKKLLLEKEHLKTYYPKLVLDEQNFTRTTESPIVMLNTLFIRTIGIRFHLLSNDKTDPKLIAQMLYSIKYNFPEFNQFEFIDEYMNSTSLADFKLPLVTHPGASEFFTNSGLYTREKSLYCPLINGRCTSNQLYLHHLETKPSTNTSTI